MLVAGGGAAGLTIVPIARELGCRRCWCRARPAHCRRCGGLYSRHRHRVHASAASPTPNRFDFERSTSALATLDRARCDEFFDAPAASRGRAPPGASTSSRRATRTRCGSSTCRSPSGASRPSRRRARSIEAFHDVHERVFAVTRARPARRVPVLEGPATARCSTRRRCRARPHAAAPARAARGDAAGLVRRPRRAVDTPRFLDGDRCRPARGSRARDRRGADDDGRRLSGLGARRRRARRLPARAATARGCTEEAR